MRTGRCWRRINERWNEGENGRALVVNCQKRTIRRMKTPKETLPQTAAGKNGSNSRPKRPEHPFRSAVIRGLGVVTPPLLTIVIFLWVGSTVQQYVLAPITTGLRDGIVWATADIQLDPVDGKTYRRVGDGKMVPIAVYDLVQENQGAEPIPPTAQGIYQRYVELRFLRPYLVVPAFLAIFILVLYLLGKFIAAGIGRFFVNQVEQGIQSLPLVRNVYSSVKQISDFLFSPREIEYTRVVAIEYPRKGIWSLGLVTGESMLDIRSAANEPVISVLIPTSPMPVTGYTINIKKSETIDLNITIDQAFQFIVSCGVVVPPQQVQGDIDVTAATPQLPDDAAK